MRRAIAVRHRPPAPLPPRAALVWVLLVALWFASTLGLVHRTLHGLPASPASLLVSPQVAADAARVAVAQTAPERPVQAALSGLFGKHAAGDAECRLYDQLAHGAGAPGVPLVILPLVLPQATFAFFLGEAVARWVALFDARGPPLSR